QGSGRPRAAHPSPTRRSSDLKWFPTARISRIHGQARKVNGRLIVPFFHPAAALHQPTLRQAVEEDFRKLPGYVAQALAERGPDEDRKSTRLNSSHVKISYAVF